MINEFRAYLVPNQYSSEIKCPKGTCTYRDDASYFVFYDNGILYSADMLIGRIDNAGMDKIIYYDPWSDGKEPQWVVERQTVSENDCPSSVLASRSWIKHGYIHLEDIALTKRKLNKILQSFRTSPMGIFVTDIIEKSLVSQGYDELFWDCVGRRNEPFIAMVEYCDSMRKTLEEAKRVI